MYQDVGSSYYYNNDGQKIGNQLNGLAGMAIADVVMPSKVVLAGDYALNYAFSLADGYAGNPFPPSYSRYPIWTTLTGGELIPDYAAQLRRFVDAKGVTAIVVDEKTPGPWTTLFKALGVRPLSTGGVLLYRIRASD